MLDTDIKRNADGAVADGEDRTSAAAADMDVINDAETYGEKIAEVYNKAADAGMDKGPDGGGEEDGDRAEGDRT